MACGCMGWGLRKWGLSPKIGEPNKDQKICGIEMFSYSRWFMNVVVLLRVYGLTNFS
jgi:hypothetical protein